MSCSDYKSNCMLYTKCCQKYVCCWVCHNKTEDHNICNEKNIKHLKCNECDTINELSNECKNCHIKFNTSYCSKCILWSTYKNTFHCDQCRICIKGKRENYIHCSKCDTCINKLTYETHNCNVILDSSDCQICMEEFNKRDKYYIVLRCSHKIHTNCYANLKKNCEENDKKFNCGLCKKSIISPLKLEKYYDKKKIKYNYNSYENNLKTKYYCNDCNINEITLHHPKYIKCIECKSYNTESTGKI